MTDIIKPRHNRKVDNFANAEFIFGGTFDPVHFGHLSIIRALNDLASEIPVRIMPCALPALKAEPGTSFQHRSEMLKLATKDFANIVIDQREALQQGYSYSVNTLQSLKREFPDKQFIMVIGADSLLDLSHWYQWQKLPTMCHLLVVNRPGISIEQINSAFKQSHFASCEDFNQFAEKSAGGGFLLKMAEKPQSSSEIRQSIANNRELDSMLPHSVIEYIRNHQLFVSEKN